MNRIFKGLITGLLGFAALNATAAMAVPTDPEIMAIVEAANTAEIDAGKLAQTHAQNAQVKQFAKHMVKSHTHMNASLAKKIKMKPMTNDTSEDIRKNALDSVEKLKGMQGADFDKAYIDNQVTMHEKVLDMVNNTLLPNAQNEQLKAALTKAAPEIKSHLEKAKKIQSSMS